MNGEKSANKAFPQDTEETEGEVGTPEQSQKQIAGTTNVVQTEPGLEALKELAEYVNTQCVRLWEQIVKSRQLIHHTNREVSRAIVGVVDDVCSDAQNEDSFYRCLMAYHVMASVLLGRTPHNEPICPLAMRLIEEETRKSLDQVRDRLKDIVNATLNRLDIAPERKSELERRAIEHIMEGRFYVDIVLERIRALAVQRMKPLDFRNFVAEAEINEFENKIMIHAIIPKAGEPADATENLESFTIVNDLKKVGTTYLVGRDFEYFVSDLSRPEAVVLPSPPKGKGKEDSDLWAIGNFEVVIPSILLPAIDRFLRMGWIPDGTSNEFLDAIHDKIRIIKTPEEMFADTLARVLSGYHWVVVKKTESGQYELESDIPITTENPWQRYTFLVHADGEVWIPYPMWRKAKDMFEKARIPRNMIEYIIKNKKISRSASTCGSGRAIVMLNLVVLDVARVEEVLNDKIENHIVFKEPPCEGEGE
jgi:hypothetical protein